MVAGDRKYTKPHLPLYCWSNSSSLNNYWFPSTIYCLLVGKGAWAMIQNTWVTANQVLCLLCIICNGLRQSCPSRMLSYVLFFAFRKKQMLVGFRRIIEGGGKGNSPVDLVKRFADSINYGMSKSWPVVPFERNRAVLYLEWGIKTLKLLSGLNSLGF